MFVNNRRIAVAGLAVLTAAGLALTSGALTGCTSKKHTPAANPANAALTAALSKLKGASYNVTTSQNGGALTGVGAVDATKKAATLAEHGNVAGQSVAISAIQIGDDIYAKLDLGGLNSQAGIDPSKWLKLDPAKLTTGTSKPFDLSGPDAFGVATLLSSVSNVTQVDANHLGGSVDLTKATGVDAPDSSTLSSAGPAAKTTPFSATLDNQGRLVDFKVNADSFNKDLSEEITFSDYGSPTTIKPPLAAQTVPAPAAVYQIFNS
jgi:hypothetical protein